MRSPHRHHGFEIDIAESIRKKNEKPPVTSGMPLKKQWWHDHPGTRIPPPPGFMKD